MNHLPYRPIEPKSYLREIIRIIRIIGLPGILFIISICLIIGGAIVMTISNLFLSYRLHEEAGISIFLGFGFMASFFIVILIRERSKKSGQK